MSGIKKLLFKGWKTTVWVSLWNSGEEDKEGSTLRDTTGRKKYLVTGVKVWQAALTQQIQKPPFPASLADKKGEENEENND